MQTTALTEADIPACMALSTEAGWNQNEADWRRIMGSGEAHGLRDNGTLIASSAILPYGTAFGWICMILVTASAQRRGHAMRLMKDCIERLEQRQFVAGLDATPAGRTVYIQLGFEDIYPITRLYAERLPSPDMPADDLAVSQITAADWRDLLAFDAVAFGSDRAVLLRALQADQPNLALIARRGDALAGYAFGRSGRFATHLGPIVSAEQEVAARLVEAASSFVTGPVSIDVPDHQRDLVASLEAWGFKKQRGFTRMLRGRKTAFGEPLLTMAITGPEFG